MIKERRTLKRNAFKKAPILKFRLIPSAMSQKAIKIDLSTFFNDERKFCCILMDPNWSRVACLQKRVELLFDLDCVRFLTDGCFLPPQESIAIIEFCGDIKAFAPKEALKKKNKKKCKKRKHCMDDTSERSANAENVFSEFTDQEDDPLKKQKFDSLKNNHSSNKPKRLKNCNGNAITEDDTIKSDVKKLNVLISSVTVEKRSSRSKSKSTENSPKENTLVHIHTSTPMEKNNNSAQHTFDDEMKTVAENSSNISSSIFLNESKKSEDINNVQNVKNPFRKPKSNRAHIYFNEAGETVIPKTKKKLKVTQKNEEKPKTLVIFSCSLSDVTNSTQPQKSRIFHLKSNNVAKKLVEIQEEIILPAPLVQNESSTTNDNVNEFVKKKEINEITEKTGKTDSVKENGSQIDNTVVMDTTIKYKNNEGGQTSTSDFKNSNANETPNNKSQMEDSNVTGKSVMTVDLSNDLDEDDIDMEEARSSERHDQKYKSLSGYYGNIRSPVSDIEDISEVIELNESEDNTVNVSVQNKNSLEDIRIDNILPLSTKLTELPAIEDIIIFKVPKCNNNEKVSTNYIAGKVEYINKRLKSLKILVMDGFSELKYVPTRLICKLDDSQDSIMFMQIKLSDMIEPRLFSMA